MPETSATKFFFLFLYNPRTNDVLHCILLAGLQFTFSVFSKASSESNEMLSTNEDWGLHRNHYCLMLRYCLQKGLASNAIFHL